MEKKKRGYAITSIKEKGVHIATQLLASKLMQKFHADEVPVLDVALAEQCAKGVQFNSAKFLCEEFLTNCKEAQEQGKTFHYVWFLLSIFLVTGELPEDSQFPSIEQDLPELEKYASLWATEDTNQIHETKIFWVLMEASI